jgi:cytochrome P450
MTTASPVYNPYLPGVLADPYPHYRELRAEAPVHWSPIGFWVFTRYAEGATIVQDRRFAMFEPREFGENAGYQYEGAAPEKVQASLARMMLFKNAPDHTRLRSLVTKAFTARAIEGLRNRIAAIVADLLDRVRKAGHMDVIADIAYPLPAIVIAEMLGVPPEDRDQFRLWSRALASTIDPMILPDEMERAAVAVDRFAEYFTALIARRRKEPREDVLSAMIAAEDQGDRLSEAELISNAMLILNAGHETTTNLVGNGMLALLRHPEQLARLREDPSLLPGAVEELLRYDSPTQLTARRARVDCEVGGVEVNAGQQVMVILGSANRDPARFPEPDRLDIARGDTEHLSFGGGPHYCLGANLARLEGQIAIGALIATFPGLRLAPEAPEWRETLTLRGMKTLPVEF